MNTRAAGRGTTTAGIAATTDAVTTVAAAGERGRQGTTRGVIYQPGSTLTKFGTFPENRTTSVSRSLTGSSTVPFHRGGRCFVRLPVSRSLTGSSTVPVHRKGGSRQRMSGPSTMSHPAMWTCPACGRPLTVALNPEGGEAGAHRPLEISRASAAAHACAPAARFPQFHNASSSSITGYEPASCQPWQPPVSAGAEDDEGVISQSEYTLTKPSSCPNHRDHVTDQGYRRTFTMTGMAVQLPRNPCSTSRNRCSTSRNPCSASFGIGVCDGASSAARDEGRGFAHQGAADGLQAGGDGAAAMAPAERRAPAAPGPGRRGLRRWRHPDELADGGSEGGRLITSRADPQHLTIPPMARSGPEEDLPIPPRTPSTCARSSPHH